MNTLLRGERQADALPTEIYAEASVKSLGERSLFQTDDPITKDNAKDFASESSLIERASEGLKQAGFRVLSTGRGSITIAGSRNMFESVFETKLKAVERKEYREPDIVSESSNIDTDDNDYPGFIDVRKSAFADVLEGVALSEPFYPTAESPVPPQVNYDHFQVPHDLARVLRADLPQSQGIRGRRASVVLIDTGLHPHSYFRHHGIDATNRVRLAPTASMPGQDESGHGTAMCANLLAIAPGVEFTMVKLATKVSNGTRTLLNTPGAVREAVRLAPRVISCSWGVSREHALNAEQRVLAFEIALAVENGITVTCAAGNSGGFAFPGQHPDVISVGGVNIRDGGIPEASDYSSGYVSKIFRNPDRKVPDVCGLVGLLPKARLIMLPVPAGSTADVKTSGGSFPLRDETKPDDGWAVFSGTSSATAQVAGVCALAIEAAGTDLKPEEVKEILMSTATDVSNGHAHADTGGHAAGVGFDHATGSGLVNAAAAVARAQAH